MCVFVYPSISISISPITMSRGSMEDTTGYATTNSTGYAESVLGAGIGSNGKVIIMIMMIIIRAGRPSQL